MKAYIDRDGCIGCGLCAGICPDVFAMDDDGKAEVIADLTAELLSAADEAAESCPVEVITIDK